LHISNGNVRWKNRWIRSLHPRNKVKEHHRTCPVQTQANTMLLCSTAPVLCVRQSALLHNSLDEVKAPHEQVRPGISERADDATCYRAIRDCTQD
jgi:hypothetical protein